jgi:hypothetical protein
MLDVKDAARLALAGTVLVPPSSRLWTDAPRLPAVANACEIDTH